MVCVTYHMHQLCCKTIACEETVSELHTVWRSCTKRASVLGKMRYLHRIMWLPVVQHSLLFKNIFILLVTENVPKDLPCWCFFTVTIDRYVRWGYFQAWHGMLSWIKRRCFLVSPWGTCLQPVPCCLAYFTCEQVSEGFLCVDME